MVSEAQNEQSEEEPEGRRYRTRPCSCRTGEAPYLICAAGTGRISLKPSEIAGEGFRKGEDVALRVG